MTNPEISINHHVGQIIEVEPDLDTVLQTVMETLRYT